MATDTYDYTTDKEFLNAPPEQQHAYLQHIDPEYAGAHPDQQRAYLGHINGGQYSEKGAASNPPMAPASTSMNKVEPLTGGQVTPEQEQSIENRAASVKNHMITPITDASIAMAAPEMGETVAQKGIGSIAKSAGRGLLKSAAGTIGLGGVGAAVGAPFGKAKEGAEIGGAAGLAGGPFVPDSVFADAPYGLNKLILGEEGVADSRAASKVAQNEADIRAGLTQHPGIPAHAEMEADIAQQHQNRVAANDEMNREISEGHQFRVGANNEMEQDIQKGRQERAAGRDTAYNDLAQARNSRAGDVATEGQQTSTGHSTPIGPSSAEHYENRANNLVGRTGDVETEGQQASSGHSNPLGPSTPTSEENLTRAEKAGKASKVPNRMPRSKAVGADTESSGGGDRQAGVRGANEGSPARWTNERVYELAAKGNRDALMEIRQRQLPAPPNSRYVTGDVSAERVRTGPLALSTSETEHMPITPGSKVRGISKNAPRETVNFDAQGNVVKPNQELPEAGPTVGNGKPIVPTKNPPGLRRDPSEVMVQPANGGRATPTGEATIFNGENTPLPKELKAELEAQAGRPLTDDEAIMLDRENAKKGMLNHNPEDIGSAREVHRATLEKKGER